MFRSIFATLILLDGSFLNSTFTNHSIISMFRPTGPWFEFFLPLMPWPEFKLTLVQLHLFRGTLFRTIYRLSYHDRCIFSREVNQQKGVTASVGETERKQKCRKTFVCLALAPARSKSEINAKSFRFFASRSVDSRRIQSLSEEPSSWKQCKFLNGKLVPESLSN